MSDPVAAVLFDTEFLTIDGALRRGWFGPDDPDPIAVQIGAVSLALTGDFAVQDTLRLHIVPRGRDGALLAIDPYLTDLTGITSATLGTDGRPLADALASLTAFAKDAPLWSWGKDELYALAISCYVAGIAPPLPAHRFGNVRSLVQRAGMSSDDLERTGSGSLAAYYGAEERPLSRHDALDDALSLAWSVRHLLRTERLVPADFALPAPR